MYQTEQRLGTVLVPRLVEQLGKAEVADSNDGKRRRVGCSLDQYVAGFQVAVQHAAGVGMSHGLGQRDGKGRCDSRCQRLAPRSRQPLGEARPVDYAVAR